MKIRLFNLILILTLGLLTSCKNDDNGIDCAAVSCFGGDVVQLTFFKNGQNLFEIEPNIEIEIIQNNENADFNRDTVNNQINLFLQDDDPITILIDNQELNIEISSTFIDGECCSGIKVDNLKIDNSIICENEECDEIIQIILN